MKKTLSLLLCLLLFASIASAENAVDNAAMTYDLRFNNSAWNYNDDDDVYWQVGVVYCTSPETTEYESLGIYVPGVYMTALDNGDGTFTCAINTKAVVNGYTAETAPIVIPVMTAGYSAQPAPTAYSSGVSSYLQAGFIYVYPGCRGRSNGYDADGNLIYSGGAPWGVTDLKAAIRYLRYNSAVLPGDTERIFSFGMSGGGAQSSLIGATGDSEMYFPYLESIGAAMTDASGNSLSDAVYGSMCWCPITSLDFADAAYEWNMGQYASTGTRAEDAWTSALSSDLAKAYAEYINTLGLTDESGTVLMLEESQEGIYASGSYYDYLLSEINRSINNFLSDTTFPYTTGGSFQADGGFPGRNGAPSQPGDRPMGGGNPPDGIDMGRGAGASQNAESVTYETVQDYIDSLNTDGTWVEFDAASNTAKIVSLGAFVTHCKNASKSVGAFDDLNRNQAENQVFGTNENDALHFDATMAALLQANEADYAAYADWNAAYVDAYAQDLASTDVLGNSIAYRQNMYNPMYYLSNDYEGFGSSTLAKHWRIHTGIEQGDTALTVEMNLALLLQQNAGVKDVDFEMVWEQAHTTAERTGDSTTNLIAWVNDCCQ